MEKEKSRKRKFKVPRGTGVKVATELGLAASHVTRVINGKREGGPTLANRLRQIEYEAAVKEYHGSMKGFRQKIAGAFK